MLGIISIINVIYDKVYRTINEHPIVVPMVFIEGMLIGFIIGKGI